MWLLDVELVMACYTILLTACINPKDMSFTYLLDAVEREKQYIEAVNYYLKNTKFNIVFCNNSGEDISNKIKVKSNRFECLTFQGNDYDRDLGKGYGEILILKYALVHSKFIKKSDYIIKITGRLIVPNLSRSINTTNLIWFFLKCKIYFNAIDRDLKMIDSRCFIADNLFLESIIQKGIKLNDSTGYYFEHLLFDIVYNSNNLKKLCLFYPELTFSGISGSTGVKYVPDERSKYQNLLYLREYLQLQKNRVEISKFSYYYLSMMSLFVRVIKIFVRRIM